MLFQKACLDSTSKLTSVQKKLDFMCPLIRCTEKDTPPLRGHVSYRAIPTKNVQPKSNHEETSEKAKLSDILKNKWFLKKVVCTLQKSQGHERQRKNSS